MKTIYIASDHAGYELKTNLIQRIKNLNLIDKGCNSNSNVDYPDYAHMIANSIIKKECDAGILICNTGIGMSIAANRHNGIRAALCHNTQSAKLSREHNDANILCIGSLFVDLNMALEIIQIFFNTDFENGRHIQRLQKI